MKNRMPGLCRVGALVAAVLMPAAAWAQWNLPANPTAGSGGPLSWTGQAQTSFVTLWALPPSPGDWLFCGAGAVNQGFVTANGGVSFFKAGTWTFKATDGSSPAAPTLSSTTTVVTAGVLVPPAAPTGLTATNITSTSFTFTWSASSGATSYEVQRDSNPSTTTTSTSISVGSLSPSATYLMSVRASNAAGTSAWSQLNVTTAAGSCTQNIGGWTIPCATNLHVNVNTPLRWIGFGNGSTIIMYAQAPGSGTWTPCGGGGGSNPTTVNGGITWTAAGTWTLKVVEAFAPNQPVLDTLSFTVSP